LEALAISESKIDNRGAAHKLTTPDSLLV